MQNILLLYGALGHKGMFDPILPLLKNDFTVYTFDFSGHGGKPLTDSLSIQGFAEETAAFIKDNIGGEVNIFGHSMGGYVGLYMARHGMVPIERVMTLGTKLDWNPDFSAGEIRMLDTAKMKEKIPAYTDKLARIHGSEWELLCAKTRDMMQEMGQNPPLSVEDFEQINILIQLSVGDKDRMVSMEETIRAYRKLPNGRMLVMPSTPHPFEQADVERVAWQIQRFIKG